MKPPILSSPMEQSLVGHIFRAPLVKAKEEHAYLGDDVVNGGFK